MLKYTLLKLIRLYQKTLSPDSGWFKVYYPHGYCKFYPHCSEYGHQAIDKHGALRGGVMTIWRVLRCNPFTSGGQDPVK
jgi:uncharacterized protein